MEDEKKTEPRILTDVFGVGEFGKEMFGSFREFLKKLPFEQFNTFQTIFVLMWVFVNVAIFSLFSFGKVDSLVFYILLLVDGLFLWKCYSLAAVKVVKKKPKRKP